MRALLLTLSLLVTGAVQAQAIDIGLAFEDPELQARYEQLIEEVRCLKCQNQSIKDSNAFLASDLRREIRRLLEEGKTNDEIYDFLVARYGDFALYRPRTTGRTAILWYVPGIFLILGVFMAWRVIARRANLPIDDDSAEES